MKTNTRMTRVNDEVQREISEIIRTELKDPRISPITSAVKAEVTKDLKFCKVYISVLGNDKEKHDTIEALKSASGFIRKMVAQRVNLRNTPELTFVIDDSMEYAAKISKLIDSVKKDI